jgi:hypothetical protein
VAAAVLIACGGGAYVAANASGGGTGSSGAPPPLALGTPTESPAGIAEGEPDPNGVIYRAGGELPEGPGSARVYRSAGDIAVADVARLARALGVAQAPRSDGTGWKAGAEKDGAGPVLRVEKQAPGTWTFARFGAPPRGDNCLRGKSCPSGTGSGTGSGAGEGSAVSEQAAKKAAAPVLAALGQDDAELDARQLMGAVRVVNADPVIGGLPTYGWSTGIEVGADGQVAGGSGQLKAPEPGEEYPVIGAAGALEELNEAAGGNGGGRIGGCATAVPLAGAEKPAAPCEPAPRPPGKPVVIDKAVFGLAAHPVDGRRALVPSWLFEVRPGGDALPYTVTRPAVAPEFLTGPTPPRQEMHRMSGRQVESYRANGRALSLRFWGGVCGDYAAQADEGGTAVKVRVTDPEPDPGRVCVALAKEQTVTVVLDRPLGGRQVVDGATGEKVPLG